MIPLLVVVAGSASLAGLPDGTYRLAAVRRASDVAAPSLPAEAARATSGDLHFGPRLTWLDGSTCDAWRLEDGGDASRVADDPNLSDLQMGRLDPATEDHRINRLQVVHCDDRVLGSLTVIDERVLVARSRDGSWLHVYEAPLGSEEVRAAQRALAARGLYEGPLDGEIGESTRRAVALYADRRGAAYAFAGSPLTENLLLDLLEPMRDEVHGLINALLDVEMALAERSTAIDDSPAVAHDGSRAVTSYGFRSTRPIREDEAGKTFLRYRLRVLEYESAASASAASRALLESAHPDTGLSYAWDLVARHGGRMYWLSAPCLLSSSHWQRLRTALLEGLPDTDVDGFECRCGRGCSTEGTLISGGFSRRPQ